MNKIMIVYGDRAYKSYGAAVEDLMDEEDVDGLACANEIMDMLDDCSQRVVIAAEPMTTARCVNPSSRSSRLDIFLFRIAIAIAHRDPSGRK